MKKSVYEKIIRAAERGTGTRLTPDEVWELGENPDIVEAAKLVAERREVERKACEMARKGKLWVAPALRKRQ